MGTITANYAKEIKTPKNGWYRNFLAEAKFNIFFDQPNYFGSQLLGWDRCYDNFEE